MSTTATKDIKNRINLYEDACRELNREPLTIDDFSTKLPNDKRQYLLSVERVTTVIEAMNEGHQFDWNSYDEDKYYPYWDMETYGDDKAGSGFSLYAVIYDSTSSAVGARLSSRTEEHAEHVAKIMFEDYRIIMKG